jgi:site-specific DNA recombinase
VPVKLITLSPSLLAASVGMPFLFFRALMSLSAGVLQCTLEWSDWTQSDWRMSKIIAVAAAVAQNESESKNANIKWGIQRSFEKGYVKLNHTNFLGFTKDENGKLVVVEKEAKIVRLI